MAASTPAMFHKVRYHAAMHVAGNKRRTAAQHNVAMSRRNNMRQLDGPVAGTLWFLLRREGQVRVRARWYFTSQLAGVSRRVCNIVKKTERVKCRSNRQVSN